MQISILFYIERKKSNINKQIVYRIEHSFRGFFVVLFQSKTDLELILLFIG